MRLQELPDGLGKLAQISRSGMSAAYLYGPGGMRESKSVSSAGVTRTTQSVWSGMTLVAERDSDGTRYEYIYGAGVPLELVVTDSGGASERYGYQVDAAGSVIGITDAAGAVIANYAYDPYGVPTATSGTDPLASRNPLRYRGYYYDTETGLYYLPARYYEPRSARFLSVDPAAPSAGDPASLNRYSYCFGDPVNASDPTGAIVDTDGNGRVDSHDSAREAATHAKSPARCRSFRKKAASRYKANRGRLAKEAARSGLPAGRSAAGGLKWYLPTKADSVDLSLDTVGMYTELGQAFILSACAVESGTAILTSGATVPALLATLPFLAPAYYGLEAVELTTDYMGIGYTAYQMSRGKKTPADLAVQAVDMALVVYPAENTVQLVAWDPWVGQ